MRASTLALIFLGCLILALGRATALQPVNWRGELPGDTTLCPADNPHIVEDDLIVPAGVTLTIEPGVELRFAPQASLLVYGRLQATGSPTQPITLTWRDEGVHWGALAVIDSPADNRLAHAVVAYAGEEPSTTPRNYGITVRRGRLTIADCLIYGTNGPGIAAEEDPTLHLTRSEIRHTRGDALHAEGGQIVVQDNHIHDIAWGDHNYEGLSLNEIPPGSPAMVQDNHIHQIADDCLDLNGSSAVIERNRLHNCGDKGISIGSIIPRQGQPALDSLTSVVNNLVYSNTIGLAIKDSAVSHLAHNTIVDNQAAGLALYDHLGFGGGQAVVANTILWGNGAAITLDSRSSISVTWSDVAGGWPGQGNLNADPLFSPFGDYRLTAVSPCRDAGSRHSTAVPATDLDGLTRTIGAAPDVGAYEWPPLRLAASPGDATIHLRWLTVINPTAGASYAISYTTHPGEGMAHWTTLITGLPTTTLSYSLTDLANYTWHTVTVELQDRDDQVLLHSNPVAVMPTDHFVYLPMLLKAATAGVQAPPFATLCRSPCTVYLPLVAAAKIPKPALYQMSVDPDDLAWLDAHASNRELVPAQFVYEGFAYDVGTRYRGEIARWLPKKSWKVQFDSSQLFYGQREINLNAEYPDKSLMREWLSYDLFERAGLIAPRASFARLYVNGEYRGLFTEVDQVDQRFLDRFGLDPNGNLYKGDYGSFHPADSPEQYAEQYIKKTNKEDSNDDLIAFVELVNDTPAADMPATLAAVIDVGSYLDWYAIQTLIGNFEWVEKNYYLYHDLQADRWLFMPWDLDLTFGHNHTGTVFDEDISWDNPIDGGSHDSPKPDGVWNQLTTVVLEDDSFRDAYCRRLRELMHDEFSAAVMFQRIDLAYRIIQPYGEADPHKWGEDEEFNDGPNELKTYVVNRLAWLNAQMPDYCPDSAPPATFNELMSHNTHTLPDAAGEFEPWIELHNPGLVSFDLGGLQIRASAPRPLTCPGERCLRAAETAWAEDSAIYWTVPEGTVLDPGDFVLIWADGEPSEGPLHASFRLDTSGGQLELVDKPIHGSAVIAHLNYGPLGPDLSYGRQHDGGADFVTFQPATPGWSNQGHPPCISAVQHTPAEPEAGEVVTVTAVVSAEHNLTAVWLHYDTGAGETTITMTSDGSGYYSATLPAQVTGTLVRYSLRAQDSAGLTAIDPPQPPSATQGPAKITHHYRVGFHRPPLTLNEFVAINDNGLRDEDSDTDDWFEIHNAGSNAIDLGGMHLTDAIENTTKWQIPAGVVAPAQGYVIFWADNETEEGLTHANFKLDGDSGRLALYASQEAYNELVDQVYYRPQTADRPAGRYPDGVGNWRTLPFPTPGEANRQPPPVINKVSHTPSAPQAGETVTITAHITDDGTVTVAALFYNLGDGWQSVGMTKTVTSDGLYAAVVPPAPEGDWVVFYIEAQDDAADIGRDPVVAPTVLHGYRVGPGCWNTPLINELMADNETTLTDEAGEYEDWVELYNRCLTSVDVGGLYLSDDLSDPDKWHIPPTTTIPSRGFALLWTDDDPEDGPLHATFKLSKGGEELGLFQQNGTVYILMDWVVFGPQAMDTSYGRTTDGHAAWINFTAPTPGATNQPIR